MTSLVRTLAPGYAGHRVRASPELMPRQCDAGATLPLLAALSRQWRSVIDAGHGREDVSVARLGLPDKS